MRPTGCHETSLGHYNLTPPKFPKERRSQIDTAIYLANNTTYISNQY